MTPKKKYESLPFYITNTMSGKRELFQPLQPSEVKFYSCGPTVYGPLHIGNARALIVADLFFRWLKYLDYNVLFVRNYTDIDDKIIKRAIEEKKDSLVVSEFYIDYCNQDIRSLGLESPTKTVKVTESLPAIKSLISDIIKRGHAYVSQGEVLFSIESFKSYGALSGKNIEDLQAGARVEVDQKKKNPLDFSLWKPHKPGEPSWKSEWSEGRPGWHIECSAMIREHLGDQIDLHHGGQDLIFPHHENEIAQSEAATGKSFSKYWVHHAFLTSGNEKMSKSLGNILTIREFVEKYGAELLKYIYLSFHYRSAVPYTQEMVAQAVGELERIYTAKAWAVNALDTEGNSSKVAADWKVLETKVDETFEKIEKELAHDLNTPGALGHLFTLIREINRISALDSAPSKERGLVATAFLGLLEERLASLWNVFKLSPQEMKIKIEEIRKNQLEKNGVGETLSSDEIESLIEERKQAKASKNFARADEIRKDLDQKGILLVDSKEGTTWKYKG
jgi:cysteinyl-tRNA synthetase